MSCQGVYFNFDISTDSLSGEQKLSAQKGWYPFMQQPTTPPPLPQPPTLPTVCVPTKIPGFQSRERRWNNIAANMLVGRKAVSYLKKQEKLVVY